MTPKLRTRSQSRINHNTNTQAKNASNKKPVTTPTNISKKRTLSPDQTTPKNTSSKKNKESSPQQHSTMNSEEMIRLLNEQTAKIENTIQSSQNVLESKFNDLAEKVKEDVSALKASVADLHKKMDEELGEVKSQVSSYAERMDNNDDDYQRLQRNYDLRLTGFAFKDNENLYDIFKQIAAVIGFDVGPNTTMPSIERVNIYNKKSSQITPSPTILLHFAILRQKQQFYALYLNKMPLDPEKLGLSSDNRIVIGENLTRKNAQIFKQAQSMKRDNKIAQTFTEDGIVKIKFTKGKNVTAHAVRNTIALEALVVQHQQAALTIRNAQNQPTQLHTKDSRSTTPATLAPTDNNKNSNASSSTSATAINGSTTNATNNGTSDNSLLVNNNNSSTNALPMEIGSGS